MSVESEAPVETKAVRVNTGYSKIGSNCALDLKDERGLQRISYAIIEDVLKLETFQARSMKVTARAYS